MSKITFIIYGDINQNSGGYYYDREFVKALEKRGYLVTVVDALNLDETSEDPDLYIIDELCHPDFYRKDHFTRLRRGVPVAAMVHHLAADENLNCINRMRHLRMERRFLKNIDFAVFNSCSTRLSCMKKGGYNGPFEIAVPGRVDDNSILKKKNDSAVLSLIFIGNLIPRKGIHHVIKHLAKFRGIPFNLNIVGDDTIDPAYTRKLKSMIKKYKLDARIKFTGFISEPVKAKLLGASDLFVMPSSHEGYGIAYIEAMQYGIISVAGNSGGASEIITDDDNGYIINPKDGIRFRKILCELWSDASLMQRMSNNAVRRWEEHPVWEQSFEPVINELEKIML